MLHLWQNKAAVVYDLEMYPLLVSLLSHKCGHTSKQSYNRTNRFLANSGLLRLHDMPGCASACHIINNVSLWSRQRDQHFPSSCVSIWTFMRLHITARGTINLIAYIFFPLWCLDRQWNSEINVKHSKERIHHCELMHLAHFSSSSQSAVLRSSSLRIQEPKSPISFSGRCLQYKTLVTVYTDLIIIKANWVNGDAFNEELT